jgi:hypothetical protein
MGEIRNTSTNSARRPHENPIWRWDITAKWTLHKSIPSKSTQLTPYRVQ